MNWTDVLVLTVIAFSGMLGVLRGLVREILGVAAWVGAAILAVSLFQYAQPVARRAIINPDLADPAAFLVLFVFLLIVFSIVARVIGAAVRFSVLGGLDRTLGLAFGLGRGALLAFAAYIGVGMLFPPDRWPEQIQEARSIPLIYQGAVWVAAQIPDEYRPRVAPPPQSRATTPTDQAATAPSGTTPNGFGQAGSGQTGTGPAGRN